jgi:hypothetical protein
MKRNLPIAIALAAVLVLAANCSVLSGPRMGDLTESFETSNHTFKLRVDRHAEVGGFMAIQNGAYYVFRSAAVGSDAWDDIMTFRHDDPNPIPLDQVRFVNERVGFVFMGWKYAVSTDGGATWKVWDATRDLRNWQCCNYRLIASVQLNADGNGTMTLSPIQDRRGEVPELHTSDFGRHWSV